MARLPAIPAGLDFVSSAHQLARTSGGGRWAGYSMGGRLALQVTLDHPEQVDHLVMISATAGIRDPRHRALRRREDEQQAATIERDGVERFLDHWTANPLFAGADPEALRSHRLRSATAMADQLRRLGQGMQPPLWDRLGEITCPVTIVAGERDPTYVAIAGELMDAIPEARLEIVPDAGHALLVDQPGQVTALLADLT